VLFRSSRGLLVNFIKELTAEELTAKRREVRRQFKHQRAEAMAAAEAEAETAFAQNPNSMPVVTTIIPSTQTAKLNQQLQQLLAKDENESLPELAEDEIPDNLEHLQLSLQEAFFLAWTVRCLHLYDEVAGQRISLPNFWQTCFESSCHDHERRIDNPFLTQYVVYHHFRSLGWVVKSGIKFCVDYLLYKRGPVFHHAEFAIVVVPSYSNPDDKVSSPYNQPNVDPLSWQWLSTLNRANSQVMKVRDIIRKLYTRLTHVQTLVLVYVVIPSSSDVSSEMLLSPKILELYSVKEVIIRRFIAARMRD
jgi:tRNA-splicing endonuclease subunit Sen2